jgi:hypothetical protein
MTAALEATTVHADPLERLREDGACVLRGLLPLDLIERLRAAYMPLYRAFAASQPDNRGPSRHYLDVPFSAPFADPLIYENPTVLALVDELLGSDAVLLHYGADTPSLGSEAQGLHSDLPDLFPGRRLGLPTFVLTVNIPLVDITLDNGPFEGAPGTHRFDADEAMRRIQGGESPLVPFLPQRGDVMVRDPRMVHRGTANRTPEPRPVLVVAYHRPWYRHGGFEPMGICTSLRETLSPRARTLLRLHLDRRLV